MLISKPIFFDHIASAPKEELHQFLIGLYGEHILPVTGTLHEYERLLRNDMYSMGVDANGNQQDLTPESNPTLLAMMKGLAWELN